MNPVETVVAAFFISFVWVYASLALIDRLLQRRGRSGTQRPGQRRRFGERPASRP